MIFNTFLDHLPSLSLHAFLALFVAPVSPRAASGEATTGHGVSQDRPCEATTSPGGSQDRPRDGLQRPQGGQERPRQAPESLRDASREATTGPRVFQDRPGEATTSPGVLQDRPRDGLQKSQLGKRQASQICRTSQAKSKFSEVKRPRWLQKKHFSQGSKNVLRFRQVPGLIWTQFWTPNS